jgi:hypothetical protein
MMLLPNLLRVGYCKKASKSILQKSHKTERGEEDVSFIESMLLGAGHMEGNCTMTNSTLLISNPTIEVSLFFLLSWCPSAELFCFSLELRGCSAINVPSRSGQGSTSV